MITENTKMILSRTLSKGLRKRTTCLMELTREVYISVAQHFPILCNFAVIIKRIEALNSY